LEDPRIPASPVSRLDAFFSPEDGRLRFTEYNAETPAGSAYHDALTELFLALPVMRRFRERHLVRPLPVRHQVLHSLLDAYARWSGGRRGAAPVIGILDWREGRTYSEVLPYQDYFHAVGLPRVNGDPRANEYRN